MNKVCAVIVTYNRPELLCSCIEQLLLQDYPLDILVYDNHSSMDTKGKLEDRGLLNNIHYIYADSNTGGSGGFYNGMKIAIQQGYEYLWLMDDDGYAVNAQTLSNIMTKTQSIKEDAYICNSLVICDEQTLRLSFSMDRLYDGKEMQNRSKKGLLKDLINPFNGTLVTRKVVEKIGYPIKEFFVYGDETEYTLRASANNVALYTVTDSLYYHPTYVGKTKKFLKWNITIGETPLWKDYCAARNSVYYIKKYCSKGSVLKKIIRMYIGVLYAENNKYKKFKIVTKGIKDGWKSDFSKELDLSK